MTEAMPQKKKKVRSQQTKSSESDLYADWSVQALKDRSTVALWYGSDYNQTRSGGPDRDHLHKAASKLLPLARLCRNVYAIHVSLRRVLGDLHDDFKMLDDCKLGTVRGKGIELASTSTFK